MTPLLPFLLHPPKNCFHPSPPCSEPSNWFSGLSPWASFLPAPDIPLLILVSHGPTHRRCIVDSHVHISSPGFCLSHPKLSFGCLPIHGPLRCPHHGTFHLPPVQAGIVDLSRFLFFSLIPVSSFFLQNLSESENTLPTTANTGIPAPLPFPGFLQRVPGAALTPLQSVFNREESNSSNTSSDPATTLLQTLWASHLKQKSLQCSECAVSPPLCFHCCSGVSGIAVAPASSKAPSPCALPAALPCQALCLLLLAMPYRSRSPRHSETCPTWKEEFPQMEPPSTGGRPERAGVGK